MIYRGRQSLCYPTHSGTWQHEEIILKPLNPAYADIVIPNAKAEEFMVVAEEVGKLLLL